MASTTTSIPSRSWTPRAMPAPGIPLSQTSQYATALLLGIAGHHWVLCGLDTRGLHVSVGLVGLAELTVYAACLPLMLRYLSLHALVAVFAALGASGLLALLRGGHFDPKAARDLIIPLIFLWAGRSYGRRQRSLDNPLLVVMGVVIVVGLIEAAVPSLYARVFNTFNYYIGLGGFSSDAGQVQGQTVALNGLRPEGIGRTLLPQLLGQQRVSSLFLEPVSLGNFAVIMLAWALAKPRAEWRTAAWFAGGALLMIVLADSRFGLYMSGLLVLLRVVLHGKGHWIAITFPALGACALLAVAAWLPGGGDNLHGRVTVSGIYLARFDEWNLLGVKGYATAFGDMGYAYVISRFSLIGAALMWVGLFALPLHNESARRFRTYLSAYATLILCVSGTSLFALKTAGVLWFALGVLSMKGSETPNSGTRIASVRSTKGFPA
jgi:putative polymerase